VCGDLSSNAQWRVPTSRAPNQVSSDVTVAACQNSYRLLQLITAGTTATSCAVNPSVQRGPCRHCSWVTCRGMRYHTRGRTRHGAHRTLAVPLLVSVSFMPCPCVATDQRVVPPIPAPCFVVATTTYEQQQHYVRAKLYVDY
jgi:hypothetical protein